MNSSANSTFMLIDGSNNGSYTSTKSPLVCYAPTMISMGGIWKGENPLDFSFPLFLLQLLFIVLTTRATAIILQPLKQPRYLSEVIGGILLGPSVMGRLPHFGAQLFPYRSVLILETMANLGLIYFMFIIGLEIDLSSVHRSGQSVSFAAVCIAVPFSIGILAGLVIPHKLDEGVNTAAFLIFLCVTLSITAFSVLARRLAELKLLNTNLGSIALSSAMLVDSCSWILLALSITIVQNDGKPQGTLWTMLSGIAFYLVIRLILKPSVQWIMKQTPEGEEIDDFYACLILVGVLVVAFVADLIGIHAVSGAFIFGLMIPTTGSLGEDLIERIEDFVEGMLLPLFFAISGLKMNFYTVNDPGAVAFLLVLVVMGTAGKVGGCVVVARLYDMPIRDGVSLGMLMNTKGVIEMVLLNIGRDRQLLSESAFSILVSLSIAVTALTSPLLNLVARPARCLASYNRRTVEWPKPESDLRMVVCVHSNRHVPTSVALLEAANPSKSYPITVFVLHLIELTTRASTMMIMHTTNSKEAYASNPFGTTYSSSNSLKSSNTTSNAQHSDHIMHAFESYEQHTAGISMQPLTAVSPYPTMHQDICELAEDNLVALIILPFHKQQTVDGGMEAPNPAIRTLNQNVLNSAPCSVAILIDRGLHMASRFFGGNTRQQVTLLFLGGPDDREALSIASRMVEHPGISLTLVRFIAAEDSPKSHTKVAGLEYEEEVRERQLDEDCISEFRLRNVSFNVVYTERVISNAEETVAAIRATLEGVNDLYIVGKGRGGKECSPLTSGLTDWSECPELGPIGDLLASVDFGATVSVLVVQQCRGRRGMMKDIDDDVEMVENNELYGKGVNVYGRLTPP